MNNVKRVCKVCIHRDTCTLTETQAYKDDCDFKPIEKVKDYFIRGDFNPKYELQIPTMQILTNGFGINRRRCPYCGDTMFSWTEYDGYDSYVQFCCICDGALAEREYKQKLNALEKEHKEKVKALEDEYKELLEFKGMEKIIDLKLEDEKKDLLYKHVRPNEVFADIKEESKTI